MVETQYREHKRFFSTSGDQEKVTYEPYYDDRGNLELKETGKINLYMDIQSHADSVDIELILARYRAGDKEALNKAQGFYADVSGMPKSMVDILNLGLKGESAFASLPLDVRSRFDNNFAQFIATAGTKEWYDKLGVIDEKEAVKKPGESEVVEE